MKDKVSCSKREESGNTTTDDPEGTLDGGARPGRRRLLVSRIAPRSPLRRVPAPSAYGFHGFHGFCRGFTREGEAIWVAMTFVAATSSAPRLPDARQRPGALILIK